MANSRKITPNSLQPNDTLRIISPSVFLGTNLNIMQKQQQHKEEEEERHEETTIIDEDPFAVFGDEEEDDDDEYETKQNHHNDLNNDDETNDMKEDTVPAAAKTATATTLLHDRPFHPQRILLREEEEAAVVLPFSSFPWSLSSSSSSLLLSSSKNQDSSATTTTTSTKSISSLDWDIVSTLQYGRAVRAKRSLSSGTLLWTESPLWEIPSNLNNNNNNSNTATTTTSSSSTDILYQGVQWCLEQHTLQNHSICQALDHLHPTKEHVQHVFTQQETMKSTTATMTTIEHDQIWEPMQQLDHDTRLKQIWESYNDNNNNDKNATSTTIHAVNWITVRRYYLVMQYNLLRTGLYLYIALWNHQHVTPNCIKLGNDIWTCRSVQEHEMLTIDYVPEITSQRVSILWEQHKFHISSPGTTSSSFLPSWVKSYEIVLQELQEQYQLLVLQEQSSSTLNLEWFMALEQALLNLLTEVYKDNDDDNDDDEYKCLWIPCRSLYLQVGQYLLSKSSSSSSLLSQSSRLALTQRLIQQTQILLQQQYDYYGPDHLFLATTYDELVQLCQYLIQQKPKYYTTYSKMEHMYRIQHQRICRLYPENKKTTRVTTITNTKVQ